MTMTSRERMLRTLNFERPDRVPRQFWTLPAVYECNEPGEVDAFFERWPQDIVSVPTVNPSLDALRQGSQYEPGIFVDEWGCAYENLMRGVHGEVKNPILADWSKLDAVRPPMEVLEFDRDVVERFCKESGQFVIATQGTKIFERLQYLRGSFNLLCDLADPPAELDRLIEIVHQFNLKELEAWSTTSVDALFYQDDWGSQRGLLVSPQVWRTRFKPRYAEYVRIAHEAGKKMFMHSDGSIFDIYEDLIEIGVDAVNSQLFCMDIEEIGRRFAGRITFWGELDRQHALAFGSPERVRADVARVVDNLYRPEGGVIAQFELSAGTKVANAEAACLAWQELTG